MFFIVVMSGVFFTRFLISLFGEFSIIPFTGLGARTSLIIYLQSWSESMTLAPSIWWISPVFPQNLGSSSSSKIGRDIFGFGEITLGTCSLCWDDSYVQVSSNLVPRRSRIKVEKKVYGWTEHIRQFNRICPPRSDISGPMSDMSVGHFRQQHLITVLVIFC
jgi:hypothetical protein